MSDSMLNQSFALAKATANMKHKVSIKKTVASSLFFLSRASLLKEADEWFRNYDETHFHASAIYGGNKLFSITDSPYFSIDENGNGWYTTAEMVGVKEFIINFHFSNLEDATMFRLKF